MVSASQEMQMIRCVGRASKATGVSSQFESPSNRDEDSLESNTGGRGRKPFVPTLLLDFRINELDYLLLLSSAPT
jgi:hypothetical protein